MKIETQTKLTVGDLIENWKLKSLQVNHEYQRGERWTEPQSKLFIDSIFRGYSIPAFYIHEKSTVTSMVDNSKQLYIVDGQQRINALHWFHEDAFELFDPKTQGFHFPNFVKDEPCAWAGKKFSHLSTELQKQFLQQSVVVFMIKTENENSIRDLFIRLQGGTPLTPQDKRDSWPGYFTEFVLRVGGKANVAQWSGERFFKELARVSNESNRRKLVAQVFMLYWITRHDSKFSDTRSSSIDEFYHANVGFNLESEDARNFQKIGHSLYHALEGTPKVYGHYVIHLFLFVDYLNQGYAPGWETDLPSALHTFDQRRRQVADDRKKGVDSKFEHYYTEYSQWTQTKADSAESIRRRHVFFVEEMLKLLKPKKFDSKRSFSELERKTVFFRDKQECQWCRMNGKTEKISWNEVEIHHVVPYSEGGKTEIANAALMHQDCHPKGKENVTRFARWWASVR